MEKIRNFFKDESGASAVEYGLLVALIACAIIISVQALGTSISGVFTTASGTIGGAASSKATAPKVVRV